MISSNSLRMAMVWRSWVERWSKRNSLALKRGRFSRRLVPPRYMQQSEFAKIFAAQSSSNAQPQLIQKPSFSMLNLPSDVAALDWNGVWLSAPLPPPIVPPTLVNSLFSAPASGFSTIVEQDGKFLLSTLWAPLKQSFLKEVASEFPEINWQEPGYPNYPKGPTDALNPDQIPFAAINNEWERICCAGLDFEFREASAVVQILKADGYSLNRCDPDLLENVGFWLVEPSMTELDPQIWDPYPNPNPNGMGVRYLGTATFSVSDIARRFVNDGLNHYRAGVLHYVAKIKLGGEDVQWLKHCHEDARLPRLHVVVGWNQIIDNQHYNGNGVVFGDVFNGDVEFPLRKSVVCKSTPIGIETVFIDPLVTNAAPVHLAHLPDGNILFFSGGQYKHHDVDEPYPLVYENSVAMFFPETNEIENIGTPPFDIFCAGQSSLYDGNILIVGGAKLGRTHRHIAVDHNPGLDQACVFDWKTRTFEMAQDMYQGRWYPSTLVLGNGRVYVMDGHPRVDSAVHTNFELEMFSRDGLSIVQTLLNANISAGTSEQATDLKSDPTAVNPDNSTRQWRFDEEYVGLYPRIFLLQDGKVFSASIIKSLATKASIGNEGSYELRETIPIQENGIAYNSAGRVLQANSYVWDPSRPWDARQVFEGPDGSGPLFDHNDPAVLLPIRIDPITNDCKDSEIGILTFRGGVASIIYPMSTNPTWKAKRGRVGISRTQFIPMDDIHRNFGNIVLLPNKRLMLVGGVHTPWREPPPGQNVPYTDPQQEERIVGDIEYLDFHSQSSGQWRVDSSLLSVPRRYHSSSILLQDGRVIIAGTERSPEGTEGDDPPHFRPEIEIITPDYVSPNGMPVIELQTDQVGYGESLNVVMQKGWTSGRIAYYSFMRACCVTHAFGFDQRMVWMYPHGSMRQYDVNLKIPNNPNIMPPGFYLCYAVSNQGVPSCGHFIQIG